MSVPDHDLMRQRILARIADEPAPTRAAVRRLDAVIATAVAVLVLGTFFALGGIRDGGAPRSLPLMIGTFAGTLAITMAVAVLAARRSPSMLGRPRSHLLFAIVVAPLLLFVWKVLYSSLFDGGLDFWSTRIGHKCLGLSILLGISPLLALTRSRRGQALRYPRASGAALGLLAGMIAATLVDLWCPVAHPAHLAYGHLLPIVLLVATGAALGPAWLGVSNKRSTPRNSW
jgi:hypothetical protein